jgi:hypothetical protein
MSDPCKHCPVKNGPCAGVKVRRLCELVDPDNDAFDDRYVKVVVDQSSRVNNTVPEYPPVSVMVVGVVKSTLRAAASWATGRGLTVDRKELERRLEICRACDRFVPADGRCLECGCASKLKSRLVSEHCPLTPEKGGPKW